MIIKAVSNYIKRNSVNTGNHAEGEGETVMERLRKQRSAEDGEPSPNSEEMNRADDFKVYRPANDFYENEDSISVIQVEENERFDPRTGQWSAGNLHPSDPAKYKSSLGHTNVFPDIEAPPYMRYLGMWELDESNGFDGWMYGANFLDLDLGKYTKPNVRTVVRRRRWIRKVISNPSQEELEQEILSTPIITIPVRGKSEEENANQPSTPTKVASSASSYYSDSTTIDKSSGTNNTTTPVITVSENFDFDYEEDIKDNESVMSDSNRIPLTSRPQSLKVTPGQQPPPAKRMSWFGSSKSPVANGNSAADTKQAVDPTLKVRGTTLTALGKQIKFVEGECKKEDDIRMQKWKDSTKPKLEHRIIELEKKLLEFKYIIECDSKDNSKGLEYMSKLEEQFDLTNDKLDATKRELYFPFTDITLGQGGVYLALDDFWLEYISGSFFLELCPNRRNPEINLRLFGTKQSQVDGVMARLKVEGFRLAGDKGKSVPKLKFDTLMVTIAFNFQACLQFNFDTSKWFVDPKRFIVNILSFKGPYGLNRSIVSLVVSLFTPMIRNMLLKNLPFELGLLVRTLSCPLTMEGEFDIKGINVRSLNLECSKNETFMKLCDYTATQMDMFYWMQKSLERTNVMKSVADIIAYVKTYSKNPGIWKQLVNLWSSAVQIYCEKVALAKTDHATPGVVIHSANYSLPQFTIHFEKFLEAADNLLSKRVGVNFSLTQIDCQVSLNHFLSFAFQILHRILSDTVTKATSVEKVKLMNALERIKVMYHSSLEALKFISKNLDFVQLTAALDVHAGPEGLIGITVKDILAQAPILLNLSLKEDKNLGVLPLVPYIVSLKPQEDGDINLEIYHFSHDSFESPLPPIHQSGLKEKELDTASNHDSERSGSKSASFSNPHVIPSKEVGRSISSASNTTTPNLTPHNNASNNGAFQTLQSLSNIQTGLFCTSYNKVVNNITSGKVFPRNTSTFYRRDQIHKYMGAPFNDEHLEVRSEDQKRVMEEVLADFPRGDEADTVMTLSTTSPHISVIVDHSITLKPGAELITMVLGPTKPGWKPFGTSNTFEAEGDKVLENAASTPNSGGKILGWPIYMQTAPGVKFLVKVPQSEVNINIPSLFRFIIAHFVDLQQLKLYLESFFGGEFYEEYLLFGKFVLDKIAKYCLVPGLDMFCNINGRVLAIAGEILVRIETTDVADPNSDYNTSKGDSCALRVKAQISLRELLEDIQSIGDLFKRATDSVEGIKLQQQLRQRQADIDFTENNLPTVNDLFSYKQAASTAQTEGSVKSGISATGPQGGGYHTPSRPGNASPLRAGFVTSSTSKSGANK